MTTGFGTGLGLAHTTPSPFRRVPLPSAAFKVAPAERVPPDILGNLRPDLVAFTPGESANRFRTKRSCGRKQNDGSWATLLVKSASTIVAGDPQGGWEH